MLQSLEAIFSYRTEEKTPLEELEQAERDKRIRMAIDTLPPGKTADGIYPEQLRGTVPKKDCRGDEPFRGSSRTAVTKGQKEST